jgi:hypothetical protein
LAFQGGKIMISYVPRQHALVSEPYPTGRALVRLDVQVDELVLFQVLTVDELFLADRAFCGLRSQMKNTNVAEKIVLCFELFPTVVMHTTVDLYNILLQGIHYKRVV